MCIFGGKHKIGTVIELEKRSILRWMREFNATFALVRPNRQAGTTVMRHMSPPPTFLPPTDKLYFVPSNFFTVIFASHGLKFANLPSTFRDEITPMGAAPEVLILKNVKQYIIDTSLQLFRLRYFRIIHYFNIS